MIDGVDSLKTKEWTPARFRSFIKSALRAASNRWPQKYAVRKAAWLERGKYMCVGYKTKAHVVTASIKKGNKRVNNVQVDHILPIIDPEKGFVSWDEVVKRMFCETSGLQVLCASCHAAKTADERIIRKNK